MPPAPTIQANKSKNPLLLIINDISIKLKVKNRSKHFGRNSRSRKSTGDAHFLYRDVNA
jgi:hypothetical protein